MKNITIFLLTGNVAGSPLSQSVWSLGMVWPGYEMRKIAADHPTTKPIETFLIREELPVDIRHNSKIFREKLAMWAADESRRQ